MLEIGRRQCLGMLSGAALLPLAPARANTIESELGRALDQRMQATAAFGFSGQVLAAKNGKVVLDAAYGWANRSDQSPMRSDTPIGIASMTKQFSAAAIMKLKEAGKLTLEEPIGRFLPQAPADKAALTLDQLLSHTSGLAPGDLSGDFELDKKGVLASVYRSTLLPAGEWRYSNAGYNLVAAVIESASGRSYEDYLTDEIFRPAGMLRTGFPKHRSLAPGEASHAYRAWIDQGSPATWPRANYRPWGGGTAFSTAQDIFRWQRMLEGGRILSPGSVALLIASHAKPNQRNPKLGYAYGAFVEETENGFFIERSGDWERGYNAAWHRWPQEDMTLIIVSNSVSPAGLSMRQYVQLSLEELMRGKVPSPQQSPRGTLTLAERRSLAGDYPTADGSVRLRDDGAYLWATAVGQSAVELLSAGRCGDNGRPARRGRPDGEIVRSAQGRPRRISGDPGIDRRADRSDLSRRMERSIENPRRLS